MSYSLMLSGPRLHNGTLVMQAPEAPIAPKAPPPPKLTSGWSAIVKNQKEVAADGSSDGKDVKEAPSKEEKTQEKQDKPAETQAVQKQAEQQPPADSAPAQPAGQKDSSPAASSTSESGDADGDNGTKQVQFKVFLGIDMHATMGRNYCCSSISHIFLINIYFYSGLRRNLLSPLGKR